MDDSIRQYAAQARRFKVTIVPRDPKRPAVTDYYPNYQSWSAAVESGIIAFGDPLYHEYDTDTGVEKFGFRNAALDLWLFTNNPSAGKE